MALIFSKCHLFIMGLLLIAPQVCAVEPIHKQPKMYLVNITLNNERVESIYKAVKLDKKLYLAKDFFIKNSFKKEYYSPHILTLKNSSFVLLNSLQGIQFKLNDAKMELNISVPHEVFETNAINASDKTEAINEGEPISNGAYLNYNATNTRLNKKNYFNALPEVLLFSDYGALRHDSLATIADDQKKYTRLMTYYQYDLDNKMAKVVVGDSDTTANFALGRAIYGGFKYSTDFSLQPEFITYPTLNLKGSHRLPSNIDIYADNVKLYQGKLRPGEYQITDLPVIAGSGNLEVEVTDLTGNREKLIIPYYLTPTLLKKGLSAYSIEFGKRRERFAIESNKYSSALGNLYYKYGVTDNMTVSSYLQGYNKMQGVGSEVDYKLNNYGILSVNLGASTDYAKTKGYQYSAAYEYLSRNYNVGARYTKYNSRFSDIAAYPYSYPSGPSIQVFGGFSGETVGSLNMGYTVLKTKQNCMKQQDFSFLNIGYRKNLYSRVDLTANFGQNFSANRYTSFLVGFQIYLGNNSTGAITREKNGSYSSDNVEYYKGKETHLDDSYRVKVLKAKDTRYEVAYERQFSKANVKVEKNNLWNSDFEQVNLQGALVYGEGLHFTEHIRDSYTLIKVGDMPDIGVTVNNQYVGDTNHNGVVVTSNIVSNVRNDAAIDQTTVPLDAHFSNSSAKTFIPKRLKATKVTFEGYRSYNVKMNIINSKTNLPVPTGSYIKIDGQDRAFIVGFDGSAFIDFTEKPSYIKGSVCKDLSCCVINHEINVDESERNKNIGQVLCK